MIIDCTLYNGEADLLRLRIDALADVVDRFVVVEGAETFSGLRKAPGLLREPGIQPYLGPGLVYVVAPLLPEAASPWHREAHQRDAILRGLGGVDDAATVLIGDVDEIPGPELLARWAHIGGHGVILAAEQSHRAYDARNVREGAWRGTCAATAQTARQLTPEGVRHRRLIAEGVPGGWHFTHMGTPERLAEKVRSFSHQEYNTPATLQLLAARRAQGVDPFGRADEVYRWDERASLPAPLMLFPERYPMLWRDPR